MTPMNGENLFPPETPAQKQELFALPEEPFSCPFAHCRFERIRRFYNQLQPFWHA
jgi:hypothetical protein